MRFLAVYSHPYSKSFNHAILETLTNSIKSEGHEVRVRDLYALNFDPVLKAKELAGFQGQVFPEDIRVEQEHVRWADFLVFICPIWWGALTANLRGYFDRVFSLNFAYAETEKGPVGLLKDKQALFINTIGAPESVYEANGMFASMRKTMDEVISDFCGMKMIEHKFFSSVGSCSDAQRKEMLDDVERLVKEIIRSHGGGSQDA